MEKTYKILKLLIWILAFAVLIAGASLLYNRLSAEVEMSGLATEYQEVEDATGATEEPGKIQAPDVTLYDREGNSYKLSDFRGKPVILNFWASWCGFCVEEMPEFQSFYETYGEDIHFILLNATDGRQETMESATKFIDGTDYTFPVYYDSSMEAGYSFGVNAFPVTYFIDEEGYFVAWAQGMMSADMLQQGVDMLID